MARTVLAVDDDPQVLELIAEMLEEIGCDVVTARTGMEALEKIGAQHFDILITDINMPGLGGYEVAERANRLRPDLHIILLSGKEADGRGLPLLRKPFLQSDLARVMSETSGSVSK